MFVCVGEILSWLFLKIDYQNIIFVSTVTNVYDVSLYPTRSLSILSYGLQLAPFQKHFIEQGCLKVEAYLETGRYHPHERMSSSASR